MNTKLMKNALLICISIFTFTQTQAQDFDLGIRFGLSTTNINPDEFLVENVSDFQSINIDVQDTEVGYHLGIIGKLSFNNIFLQPEILFNSSKTNYIVNETTTVGQGIDIVVSEQYNHLEIPLVIGYKKKFFRVHGGIVGTSIINSNGNLETQFGDLYEEKFSSMEFGYQVGAGLEFWKLILDVKYQGKFSGDKNYITIGDKQYNFGENENRFLVSLGIMIF